MGIYQTAELSDMACVMEQLESEVRDVLRIRHLGQSHVYGSTMATERWSEGELTSDSIRLAIETETLPVSVKVRTADGLAVRCSLASVSSGMAVYAVAMEG
jgi:hypothetical protein